MPNNQNQSAQPQNIREPWTSQNPAAETTVLQASGNPITHTTGNIQIKETR